MRYSVAVKREFRDEVPADWLQQLEACKGLSFQGKPMFGRVMIEADQDGLKAARAAFGEMLHIEPVIRHQTSDKDDEDKDEGAVGKSATPDKIEAPWRRRR